MYTKIGVKKRAASSTNVPQTRPPAGVATFDCEFTAVRENEPVTG